MFTISVNLNLIVWFLFKYPFLNFVYLITLWQMEISRYLRQYARTIAGKSQLFINSYAKALEVD